MARGSGRPSVTDVFGFLTPGKGKKVEYIELIYDLIFVYLIGRNNALLEVESGFFTGKMYLTYVLSSLIVLQIWYMSAVLINRYGSNGVLDHIFLFINMYLLYYLGRGIRPGGEGLQGFLTAWGLIILNLAVQYAIRLGQARRGGTVTIWEQMHLQYHLIHHLIQTAVIFAAIPLYRFTGRIFPLVAVIFGFGALILTDQFDRLVPVDFEHLTERVMLYVVFTFGEMIVAIAGYFTGGFSLSSVYYSLFAFLIVVGLFLSYGYLYNHVIDRERVTTGTIYMLIHIGLIFALSNITIGLAFMREHAVDANRKTIYLIIAFVGYFVFMFLIGGFAKESYRAGRAFHGRIILFCAVFALAEWLLRGIPQVSIAVAAAFVFAVFAAVVMRWRRRTAEETSEGSSSVQI